jgi:isopropylmalate/homocitrate/citramalate synthase
MAGVTVCDVEPRDGLQNEEKHLDPALRADLAGRLAAAGLPRGEAVSFVNPRREPQMAGAEEVVAAIDRRPGTLYAGLVLNERGYDRLLAAGLEEAHVAFAASESFNQRNQGAAVEESLAAAIRIAERARE